MSQTRLDSARNTEQSQRDVNRRKFVQTIMASVPAISLSCAIPALGANSGGARKTEARRGEWVCAIDELFSIGDTSIYLVLNCATHEFHTFVGTAGMPLGACSNPKAGGCHEIDIWNSYERTDDEFQWVLSPDLSKEALAKLEYIRSALMANSQS